MAKRGFLVIKDKSIHDAANLEISDAKQPQELEELLQLDQPRKQLVISRGLLLQAQQVLFLLQYHSFIQNAFYSYIN